MFNKQEWIRSLFFTRAVKLNEEIRPLGKIWDMATAAIRRGDDWGRALRDLREIAETRATPEERVVPLPTNRPQHERRRDSPDELEVIITDDEDDDGSHRLHMRPSTDSATWS